MPLVSAYSSSSPAPTIPPSSSSICSQPQQRQTSSNLDYPARSPNTDDAHKLRLRRERGQRRAEVYPPPFKLQNELRSVFVLLARGANPAANARQAARRCNLFLQSFNPSSHHPNSCFFFTPLLSRFLSIFGIFCFFFFLGTREESSLSAVLNKKLTTWESSG